MPAFPSSRNRPHVVVIGGGFGGLHAVRTLKRAPVDVTLVDRSNHHLFQPLLYQVATGALSPANIASPLRSILRRQRNATVLQATATGFDLHRQTVKLGDDEIPFDFLVVAAGATHSYFGKEEWASTAPGLKAIDDATEIRGRILSAFERAERATDEATRRRCLTFVIVGGGPTGLEMAGALSELARHTLKREFRRIHPEQARIILVDAAPRVLSVYPESLSQKAAGFLQEFRVDVRNDTLVTAMEPGRVTLKHHDLEEVVAADTVVWAAGVKASPLAQALAEGAGLETDRQGRIEVDEKLSIAGFPNVLVLGDMARAIDDQGQPLPGVAPVAIQQGKYAARRIGDAIAGRSTPPFRYRDRGSMATVGRAAAVVDAGRFQLAGGFAWLVWLFLHLMLLVSFENRLLVFVQWLWSYVTRGRSARLITRSSSGRSPE
ncbi:MAG: NAD(P)/FAD-dependent oxidoreductase [Planctomycetales bacterium]|nr:NAD(P)/FAD-dependent oxidoreductase [Planctomycetales bacterium]